MLHPSAHDLKGLSGNIGLREIYTIAADLEQIHNKHTADQWRISVSKLVLISPDEMMKLEEKMKTLKKDKDMD